MRRKVYGILNSDEEVVKAINELKSKGYAGNEILVVADKEDQLNFVTNNLTTDVNVVADEHRGKSWMAKVKNFFIGEDEDDSLTEQLVTLGLTDRDAADYSVNVKAGEILVLIEENNDIGNGVNQSHSTNHQIGPSGEILDEPSKLKEPEFHGTVRQGDIRGAEFNRK
ncbi:general stress protein [Peribacillus huizhouensis]|uniref:General stress protein 17M-like domain-containing protein n=1 Tax=Peribacillus huizhouensis TaxID=1501239 RepID=A0ABR6CU34_9BACI|nr:general stress protein [Peribacillus huizhouensis]MBA9028552.1 hypothetical protein [Peribacillus huizhouensis]